MSYVSLILFIKCGFLCHVLVYKKCLITTSAFYRQHAFGEHSSLPVISLLLLACTVFNRRSTSHVQVYKWSGQIVYRSCKISQCSWRKIIFWNLSASSALQSSPLSSSSVLLLSLLPSKLINRYKDGLNYMLQDGFLCLLYFR